MNRPVERDVVIVGAGLVGSLLAVFLARRGAQVDVYERRPDPRSESAIGGRSINLVVTTRGFRALERVGLGDDVRALTVPVTGRMIHALDGTVNYQPYGRDEEECNYSVSRAELNRFLISRAESQGARFHFESGVAGVDFAERVLSIAAEGAVGMAQVRARAIFGTDGAASSVRASMVDRPGFVESVEPLEYGYKELDIPAGPDGAYALEQHALHIWPRRDVMLMALPNRDGSFTVTLYMAYDGPRGFSNVADGPAVREFFQDQFPDAVPLIADLEQSYADNPTGFLGTVRCRPWNVGGHALLLGDAAHAIVPFFGQGMNCGFEDVTVLDGLLDEHGLDDCADVFSRFTAARKSNADAIADMALENFVEMRDRVGDDRFLLRKAVEHRLEVELPREYRSRYSMVMYSHIPYGVAQEAGRIQEGILRDLCRDLASADRLDVDRARGLIGERLTPFLVSHEVSLDY